MDDKKLYITNSLQKRIVELDEIIKIKKRK